MIKQINTSAYKIPEKMIGPMFLGLAIFYLIFHVLSGERGVYALLKEDRKLEVLKAELVNLQAQRKELEHNVRLISSESLDLDMLDEQARRVLDNASQNEVVIPQKNNTP